MNIFQFYLNPFLVICFLLDKINCCPSSNSVQLSTNGIKRSPFSNCKIRAPPSDCILKSNTCLERFSRCPIAAISRKQYYELSDSCQYTRLTCPPGYTFSNSSCTCVCSVTPLQTVKTASGCKTSPSKSVPHTGNITYYYSYDGTCTYNLRKCPVSRFYDDSPTCGCICIQRPPPEADVAKACIGNFRGASWKWPHKTIPNTYWALESDNCTYHQAFRCPPGQNFISSPTKCDCECPDAPSDAAHNERCQQSDGTWYVRTTNTKEAYPLTAQSCYDVGSKITCPGSGTYDLATCACSCPALPCPSGKSWDATECACICTTELTCTDGKIFDGGQGTCSCQCEANYTETVPSNIAAGNSCSKSATEDLVPHATEPATYWLKHGVCYSTQQSCGIGKVYSNSPCGCECQSDYETTVPDDVDTSRICQVSATGETRYGHKRKTYEYFFAYDSCYSSTAIDCNGRYFSISTCQCEEDVAFSNTFPASADTENSCTSSNNERLVPDSDDPTIYYVQRGAYFGPIVTCQSQYIFSYVAIDCKCMAYFFSPGRYMHNSVVAARATCASYPGARLATVKTQRHLDFLKTIYEAVRVPQTRDRILVDLTGIYTGAAGPYYWADDNSTNEMPNVWEAPPPNPTYKCFNADVSKCSCYSIQPALLNFPYFMVPIVCSPVYDPVSTVYGIGQGYAMCYTGEPVPADKVPATGLKTKFFIVYTQVASISAARDLCQTTNPLARLAQMKTAEEIDASQTMYYEATPTATFVYIDLEKVSGVWQWGDGTPLSAQKVWFWEGYYDKPLPRDDATNSGLCARTRSVNGWSIMSCTTLGRVMCQLP